MHPDLSGQEVLTRYAGQGRATAWITSMLNKEEKPANAVPGIAYMGLGAGIGKGRPGRDGPATPGAKGERAAALDDSVACQSRGDGPACHLPSRFGTYIMYDGALRT
jgi:hypothetical protein